MSEKSKRHWFRFHLLTAVLMMFAAGGILSVALTGRRIVQESIRDTSASPPWDTFPAPDLGERHYGWPMVAYCSYEVAIENRWYGIGAAIDATVGLLFIGSVAFVSESLLRRREGRKP
jgi:hypothetical protein